MGDDTHWTSFWRAHKGNSGPPPPTPVVDFEREMAMACLYGFKHNCCYASLEIVSLLVVGQSSHVSVLYRHGEGYGNASTNPAHIASVPRTEGPVFFHADSPDGPLIPTLPPRP